MAETVHLYLKANGQDIKGESTQTSLGRANSIECIQYEQSGSVVARGATAGRREYEPISIRKRIDKSSPLLMKALCENQTIEATFKFFRPNPTGDGTTEQFYTVQIKNARIASVREIVPNTISPASSAEPPVEDVAFTFQQISWTYTADGVTHQDGTLRPVPVKRGMRKNVRRLRGDRPAARRR